MASKFKVFVSSCDFIPSAIDMLLEKCEVIQSKFIGFEANVDEARKENLSLVKGADALIWLTKVRLDAEMLDQAGPQLKIVAAASAGYDQIDVEELKRRGIRLTNTPNVLDSSVAELAIGLIIAAFKRFKECCSDVSSGQWKISPQAMLGQDIEGSTIGIIGFGGIGQTILKKMKCFGVERFIYTGHKEKVEGKELGASFVSLDTLLKESDVVILACPLTPKTRMMMNSSSFKKMKNTAILINISRGGVVDQDALVEALETGEIYAAGLDVTLPEPLPKDHPLVLLPNCFILPHIASATMKTRKNMAELAVKNALLGLQGELLLTPVF